MMTPTERAFQYADDVLSGTILAGKWVQLACQRFLNDIERSAGGNWEYEYDAERADKAVRFMERMPHVKGKWAAQKQKLRFEPWQCFIECNVFGWVDRETKLRRFRETFELIARKNSKSTKIAARALFMFVADNETGAEIYSGATSEKQAMEVYHPAWMMAYKTPTLRNRFGIEQSGNTKNPGGMFKTGDMSKFEPLVGKPGDGSNPHFAAIDEYHEHDSDHMVDAMQTGMGAREQPLLSIISTAGTNLGGPCFEKQQEIQKILEGSIEDERIFGIIYTIDEGDQWDDPDNLMKANPNFGVSVFPDFLKAQLSQARRSATKQNAFRTKHLNEWVGAKTAWMNMIAWRKQKRDMKIEDFKGKRCHVSVDLTSKKDVAAVDITFEENGHFYSFKKYFCPEVAAEDNDKYMEFVTAGVLELTDGSMVDQGVIEDYLQELAKDYDVIDFSFDEWQADYMMTRLAALQINVIKFLFRGKYISEPMKYLEAMVLDGKYWHDGNPMTTWMYGNVAAKIDARDNIFPNKARPNDPRCKIDGVTVSIMSLGRWLVSKEPEPEHKLFFFG